MFEEAISKNIKRYFGERGNFDHPSKKIVFKHQCGVCGRPLRRNTKNKIGYICRHCGPHAQPIKGNHDNACDRCYYYDDCLIRVGLGLWLRCETPDMADIERLRLQGGLDDERIRAELENILVGKGHRKILEEAISESAPKIYQDGFTWLERKIALKTGIIS